MTSLTSEPLEQIESEGILVESKKITKLKEKPLKVCKSVFVKPGLIKEEGGARIGNSYDTYSQADRNNILREIKQLVAREVKNDYDPNETMRNGKVNWVQILIGLGHDVFNGFIKEVIPRYRPNMSLTKSKLTQLRKQIRYWLKSEGIPETRGCALIREDELPEFLEKLEEVIKGMSVRSFRDLRTKILPVIEDIHKKADREFRDNVFSKHYWSDFKTKHPKVKQLWKALPGIKSKDSAHKGGEEMEIEKSGLDLKSLTTVDTKSDRDLVKHEHEPLTTTHSTANLFAGMKNWTTMLNLPSIYPKMDLASMMGNNPFGALGSLGSFNSFTPLNPTNSTKVKVPEKEPEPAVKHEDDGTNSSVKIEHVKDEPLTLPANHPEPQNTTPKPSDSDMEYLNSLATMMRTFDNMSAYIRFLLLSKMQGTGQTMPH